MIINEKIQRPNEKMNINSINTHKRKLSEIIKNIKETNIIFNGLDESKKLLKQLLWNYISDKCTSIISNFDKRSKKYEKIEMLLY